MTQPLQFSAAPAVHVLAALSGEWQALVDAWPGAVPFQFPAWLDAHLASGQGGDPEAVQLVTARRAGRLIAVLPLVLRQQRVGLIAIRHASLLHSPHMPLGDISAAADEPALWPALRDWLLRDSGLRVSRLDLPGLARDALLGVWVTGEGAGGHLSVQTGDAARIDTRMDYDSLIKSVSSKHRSNLARSTKRAETIGPLRYEELVGDDLLTKGWPLLLEIEASGWKGRAGTAISNDERLQHFYRHAIRGLGRTGHCRIGVLWFGDRPAAATLSLRAGRRLYGHKLGYREEWAAMGPGHLLMREVLQRACADADIDAVSLVLHPLWGDVWRPTLTPVDHVSYFAPGLTGRLARRLAQWRRARSSAATAAVPAQQASPAAVEG